MNSIQVSVAFLVENFYEKSQEWGFQDAVISKFGADAIMKDRTRSKIFKIENKYVVEEAQNIGPLQSDRFLSIYELGDFLCGSKIAFESSPTRLIMGYSASFYHTGILFTRRDGGEPDVVELAMDPMWKVPPTLRVSPVSEVVERSPTAMRVDNRYIKDVGMRRGEAQLRPFSHFSIEWGAHLDNKAIRGIPCFLD
eukprot:TCALIF_13827-PA protein Name:"Protein of unknown function" AED:0.63 eAED:0.83 QI:0/0/0/0.66/1/1/3/0/195